MRCTEKDFQPEAIFHIYNHSADGYDLFYDDEDYDYFLQLFEKYLKKIPGSIFAYCLMPNHYHFLIRQDSDFKIFKIFNYSFIRYVHFFNEKYNHKGSILRSPLQHIKVDNDFYLLQLCKYIHLNPVRKELVDNPEDWLYSDYNRWIDKDHTAKMSFANPDKYLNPKQYVKFVNSCFNFLTYEECLKILSNK
ncbi:MAG: transposase [Candidatus Neomarinimicrobiota bacterium]